MRKTGKSALAKYSARSKCYLVMIHPWDDGLIMVQLRHQEEMRSFDEVEIPPADIKQAELALAIQRVEQVSSEQFKPEKYTDEVRDHIMEIIDRKVNGQEIVVSPEEQPKAKIIDIMEALMASLKGQAKKSKRAPKKQAKKKPVRKQAAK